MQVSRPYKFIGAVPVKTPVVVKIGGVFINPNKLVKALGTI